MAVDTSTPNETKPTAPEAGVTVAAEAKATPPKRAARPRAAKPVAPAAPKPARKPAAAKALSTAKKTVTRPRARKSPSEEEVAHEPKPFIAKDRKVGKPATVKKAKLVRDSFTLPDGEYEQIAALKKRCLDAGVPAKKRDILRAAVANLAKLSDSSLVAAVRRLEAIKAGRLAKTKNSK
jgi:hypothetical protein